MPIGQQGFVPRDITILGAQNPKIINLNCPTSSTEYNINLTDDLKQIIIRARGNANIQISFTALESGTNFFTIPSRSNLSIDALSFSGKTLYLQVDNPTVIEVLEFF